MHVAYQVLGAGPIGLVVVPGFTSHLEVIWEHPLMAGFYRRLASFARVVVFDKRGTGMSDPVSGAPTLEERMDDVRAVMDAAGFTGLRYSGSPRAAHWRCCSRRAIPSGSAR